MAIFRPHEDAMTWKFPAASKLVVLLAVIAVAASGSGLTPADAQTPTKQATAKKRQQYDDRGRPYYGPNGPNSSYQQGRTRIYVSTRSWLDAGTEVLPGDRKFTDYAFPPGPSFGVQNNNHPLQRQPLNPDSDLGGSPTRFPLY
jgi:hypothetical protein